jgi:hypothetical protein
MIIQVPYKVGDIVSIKLASGEEMVAKLEEERDSHVMLRKPLMLVASETGIGLAPFMFTVDPDHKFKIRLNNIICVVKTSKDAANAYIKQTTGLAVLS